LFIGVVAIASFNKKQQDILINKSEKFLNYLEKVSTLISYKLEQELAMDKMKEINQGLEIVVNSVNDGIIQYESDQNDILINDAAKVFLEFDKKDVFYELLSEMLILGSQLIKEKHDAEKIIYKIINNDIYHIFVKAKYIGTGSNEKVIFIINRFEDMQESIDRENVNNVDIDSIITCDAEMENLKNKILKIASSNSSVIIMGETGTGKENFARAIHSCGSRANEPFVAINCAAIPENLLESELFGYEEGSFTGAIKGGKIGKFQLANKGTLFLDEIGDMPLSLQVKLLRVLNDKKLERIGSNKQIDIDVRIIAATNKDLEEMVEQNKFRQDLYYRLNVIPFYIPPLRDRKEDVVLLAKYFINNYNTKLSKKIAGISQKLQNVLLNYNWPGNVRELENCIEYMMNFETGDTITEKYLPDKIKNYKEKHKECKVVEHNFIDAGIENMERLSLKEIVQRAEKKAIECHSSKYGKPLTTDSIKQICNSLGISVASYYRKISDKPEDEYYQN
jgi:transcriptional regulator with PAS, ATPase and Fis domain